MNTKALNQRRSFVVVAGSLVVLAAAASWVAQAGEVVQAPPTRVDAMVIVHDKDDDGSLQTKLFLHRQGVGLQTSGSVGK